MSRTFKSPNSSMIQKSELRKIKSDLIDIDNKNWHLGPNQNINPIIFKEAPFVNLNKDNNKLLDPNSKLSGCPIRVYPESVIETPNSKRYSDETYQLIESEIRDYFPKNKINIVFNTKSERYEAVNISLKPEGYYDPKNKLPELQKSVGNEIKGIIENDDKDF